MNLKHCAEGFLLGLATGHICFATCGPVYSPYLMLRVNNWKQSALSILEISLGRFISSVIVGIAAGYLGHTISMINRSYFTIAAYTLFSVFLIVSAIRTRNREKGCALSRWSRFSERPLLLGLVTGISFCPAFLIALTRAVDLSGPVSGAFLFTGFFAGTNIFLIPLAVFGVIGSKKIARQIAVVCSFAVGIWFLAQAGISVINLYRDARCDITESDRSVIHLFDNKEMFILSADTARFNILKNILITQRTGNVLSVETPINLTEKSYVLVDPEWQKETGRSVDSLKKKNRFVIVLPLPENDGTYTESYTERLFSFLGTRYFKCDTLSGSLFDMSHFFKRGIK